MDDTEYKNFLYDCYKSPVEPGNDTNTEDNDPTYVYNDDIFSHGWRFDLDEALNDHDGIVDDDNQINILPYHESHNHQHQRHQQTYDENARSADLHELGNLAPSTQTIIYDENSKQQCQKHPSASTSDPSAPPTLPIPHTSTPDIKSPSKRRKLDSFNDPEFAVILNQQLRQQIQLLTQTYLLTKNTTNLKNYAEDAREHLDSYSKIFKNKTKPSNLLPALELVNNIPMPKDLQSSIRLSWRHLPIPDSIKRTISKHPNIFIYRDLLPQVAFSLLPEKLIPKKSKINFTINEDKLLAFALNEFKGESSQYAFIASLLMTAKTKMQISNHIKNIKRSPGNEDNPIKLYFSLGELPKINLKADSEVVSINEVEQVADEHNEDEQVDLPEVSQSKEMADTEQQAKQQQSIVNQFKILQEPETKVDSVSLIEQRQQQEQELQVMPETPPRRAQVISPDPQQTDEDQLIFYHDDIMDMDLDDLMAASTTITKSINSANSENNKNVKNLKLRKSMLSLMSHKFSLSRDVCEKLIHDFLKTSQDKLSDRNYMHLLQLLTNLMKKEIRVGASSNNNSGATTNTTVTPRAESVIKVYKDICEFLHKIQAPSDLEDKLVLFLNFDQASKCGCALNYLHWMRFFEFMQHVEMYHDGEAFEKKLARLIDALQKDDPHKLKLAAANLVNKHPILKRDFDALSLDGKPHPSLFICEEDFDDITEPISMIDNETQQHQLQQLQATTNELGANNNNINNNNGDINNKQTSIQQEVDQQQENTNKNAAYDELYGFEHFQSKPSKEEIHYATQSCPCDCHHHEETRVTSNNGDVRQKPIGQHCSKCNLKFIKGKMYLVSKIKPILARWSYTNTITTTSTPTGLTAATTTTTGSTETTGSPKQQQALQKSAANKLTEWTFEEDKEILEFCQAKAEQQEETVSFDSTTFEEFVQKRRHSQGATGGSLTPLVCKKSSRQIAERFNQLMEMYKIDENSSTGLA